MSNNEAVTLYEEILNMREAMNESQFYGPYTIYPSPAVLELVSIEQIQEYFDE